MRPISDSESAAGRGSLVRPWLWLWLAAFGAALAVLLALDLAGGVTIRDLNVGMALLRAVFAGGALTGFLWTLWMFRHLDEAGGHPWLLSLLAAALGFILCTLLFYTVEDYRGKRAWLKCVRISQARGDKLTMAEFAPLAVPDDQNFALQPIWVETIVDTVGVEKARSWYGDQVNGYYKTNAEGPLDLPLELYGVLEMTNYTGNWQLARRTDLALWQDYYRRLALRTNFFPVAPAPQSPAADVLLALSRYDGSIERLRTASALPYARFPINYTNENPAVVLLPHLAKLKGVVHLLRLRAGAELQAGQAAAALADIRVMLRLNDAIREEPFLISHLVHIAMFTLEMQPIWEGLADRRWNEAQLAELDGWLARLDFFKDYTKAMAGEKAYGCQLMGYFERNRQVLSEAFESPFPLPGNLAENETLVKFLAAAIPAGWFDQNRAAVWHFYDDHLDHLLDPVHRNYSKSNAVASANAERQLSASLSPYNRFAAMLIPALAKVANKCVFAQATLDLARLGIALERYRLAHGQFPDTLEALAPAFLSPLPHDLVTGGPLKYRRTEPDGFILYSVGLNETDDGGQSGLTMTGRPTPETGDWVWRYPAR